MDIEVVTRCTVCHCYVDSDDLFCANCGAENEASSVEPPPAQMVVSFTCQSCGASMRYDAIEQALRCPFCGSTRVSEQPAHKEIAARLIAPARIERRQAEELLRKWLQTGFWRPSDASTSSTIASMAGVYVPFWCYRGRTYTNWAADITPPPVACRGNWYPITDRIRSEYQQVLIPASSSLTQAETSAIEPFDLEKARQPGEISLAGWALESFRLPRKAVRPLVKAAFRQREAVAAARAIGNRRYRNLHINMRIEGLYGEPVLLPVWIMAYRYRNKTRRVVINGQTGKLTGQAPFSYIKLFLLILLALFVLAAIALVAAISTGR